jgi:hypothetical protein
MKEKDIQRSILDFLEASGIFHWRICLAAVPIAGGKFYRTNPMKGHPDIAGILKGGRYFTIEVKRPTRAKWYPEQLQWKDKLTGAGVVYITATSVEDVKRALQEVG